MEKHSVSKLTDILAQHESEILEDWISLQLAASSRRADLMTDTDLRRESRDFLAAFRQGIASGNVNDISAPVWDSARGLLTEISRSRARQGFTPSETATFVFSLKQPIFRALGRETGQESAAVAGSLWDVTLTLDKLGLFSTEIYQKSREEIINRQQRELLELSTPVVKLWDGVLALPLIGTLDSERTQVVMESLLQTIVETGAGIAIIDITGVPTVDTLVAQHLLKTVAAARLMGAECIISGIRPQIAATIVHLGVDLNSVVTKATLADAFRVALRRTNQTVTSVAPKNHQEARVGTHPDS
jgi:rsbT co-antagonist protein RsbR